MEILNNEKLSSINGGSTTLWFIIGAFATFIIGAISGYINPTKCNGSSKWFWDMKTYQK